MKIDPDELVSKSPKISSLPEIFFLINQVMNDPNSSFGDVARVIGYDPSLSARLLKIVNSPFYNFPQKIGTITHAISIVGTEQLRDLALATTILTTFKGIPQNQIDMNSFWRHSIATGISARVLGVECRQGNAERFFLMGVMHDVGRLILLENLSDEFGKLLEKKNQSGKLLYEMEREELGTDHGKVGAALCRAWHLPGNLEEVIGNHHESPDEKPISLDSAILHMADIVSKSMELGNSGDFLVPPVHDKIWNQLDLSKNQLASVWEQVATHYQDTVDIVLSG